MFDLTGQVAVVTGTSSGLGIQLANALAAQGADVVLLARRLEKLGAVADQIKTDHGVKALPLQCDITYGEVIAANIEKIIDEFGKIDILVNNAGLVNGVPAIDMPIEVWEQDIAVDLTGTFRMSQAVAKNMIENGYGRIINIASIFGLIGNITVPTVAYHAAKGGVVNLTRALAAEWGKHGITVNAICPGGFESEMTAAALEDDRFKGYVMLNPLHRFGRPGELNSTVVYLAAKESAYVNGVNIPVDGGFVAV